jgi:hypothetical protein
VSRSHLPFSPGVARGRGSGDAEIGSVFRELERGFGLVAGSLRAAHSQDSEPMVLPPKRRQRMRDGPGSGRQLACQEDERRGCGADDRFGFALLDGGAPGVSSRGSTAEPRR